MVVIDWYKNKANNNLLEFLVLKLKKTIKPISNFKYLERKKCIYIHIPKVAGTSIANTIFELPIYPGHYKWWFYSTYFGKKQFNSMYKFTVVRNPFDRLVSAFEYLSKGGNSPRDKIFQEKFIPEGMSFQLFVEKLHANKEMQQWIHLQPQYHFIFDEYEEKMVDDIIKFENFRDGIQVILNRLNITKEMNHAKKSNRKAYSKYYDDKTIFLVAELYNKDFELLGYETTF